MYFQIISKIVGKSEVIDTFQYFGKVRKWYGMVWFPKSPDNNNNNNVNRICLFTKILELKNKFTYNIEPKVKLYQTKYSC